MSQVITAEIVERVSEKGKEAGENVREWTKLTLPCAFGNSGRGAVSEMLVYTLFVLFQMRDLTFTYFRSHHQARAWGRVHPPQDRRARSS